MLLDGVLTASHVEGAALTFGIENEPMYGAVTALDEASGAFTYEPQPDFNGEDSFTISIGDAWARETTAAVTITVNAVNDAPRIELDTVYTVTVGEEVALPVVVTDVEGDAITVTVDALPLDLSYLDGAIAGVVAPAAADASPALTLVSASDSADAVVQQEVTWNILPVEAPASEPGEPEAPPESGEGEPPAAGEDGAAPEFIILRAGDAQGITPGSDALAGYAWQSPFDFGDCPVVDGAMTPAPLDGAASLLDDVMTNDPAGAPGLAFDVDLAAGDYALVVCGCAPTYREGERTSAPASNQAIFAGLDGVTFLSDGEEAVPLVGFAAAPGFTWQMLTAADDAPMLINVSDAGVHTVNLWMADDGVIVHALKVVPAARLEEAASTVGQVCAGSE